MRIAVTGSKGQLGTALQAELLGHDLQLIDLPEHDITQLGAVRDLVCSFGPEVLIHAAALTDVEGCERDPEAAYRLNVLGTRNVAVAAQECVAALVYISTDYVFDGRKSEPYWEYDDCSPVSVYSRTKWIGERLVQQLCPRSYVVRVAWLYGQGPRNFVRTVLRLADERGRLQMVTDEVGSPTYATDVAAALARLIREPAYGIYHLPNSGVCSRYEWAHEILARTGRTRVELTPSQNYQRLARVPARAELRNFCGAEIGISMRPWREALQAYLAANGLLVQE